MKFMTIYLLPLLGMCCCQTLSDTPNLAGSTSKAIVSSIRDAYGFECGIKKYENKGSKKTSALWWRARDANVDKNLLSDIYFVTCNEGQTYLVDIPRDGSHVRAVRTGKFVSDWPK